MDRLNSHFLRPSPTHSRDVSGDGQSALVIKLGGSPSRSRLPGPHRCHPGTEQQAQGRSCETAVSSHHSNRSTVYNLRLPSCITYPCTRANNKTNQCALTKALLFVSIGWDVSELRPQTGILFIPEVTDIRVLRAMVEWYRQGKSDSSTWALLLFYQQSSSSEAAETWRSKCWVLATKYLFSYP
jgi:hypothetical protein